MTQFSQNIKSGFVRHKQGLGTIECKSNVSHIQYSILCVVYVSDTNSFVYSCSYYGGPRGLLCIQEWDLQTHRRQLHQTSSLPQTRHALSQDPWVSSIQKTSIQLRLWDSFQFVLAVQCSFTAQLSQGYSCVKFTPSLECLLWIRISNCVSLTLTKHYMTKLPSKQFLFSWGTPCLHFSVVPDKPPLPVSSSSTHHNRKYAGGQTSDTPGDPAPSLSLLFISPVNVSFITLVKSSLFWSQKVPFHLSIVIIFWPFRSTAYSSQLCSQFFETKRNIFWPS